MKTVYPQMQKDLNNRINNLGKRIEDQRLLITDVHLEIKKKILKAIMVYLRFGIEIDV